VKEGKKIKEKKKKKKERKKKEKEKRSWYISDVVHRGTRVDVGAVIISLGSIFSGQLTVISMDHLVDEDALIVYRAVEGDGSLGRFANKDGHHRRDGGGLLLLFSELRGRGGIHCEENFDFFVLELPG